MGLFSEEFGCWFSTGDDGGGKERGGGRASRGGEDDTNL